MKDLSLRRFMLLRLNQEKEEVRRDIKHMNDTLQYIIKTEQTVRHCKKEEMDKLLQDPGIKEQYDSFINNIKELEDAERRKREERDTTPASSNEQLLDGSPGQG